VIGTSEGVREKQDELVRLIKDGHDSSGIILARESIIITVDVLPLLLMCSMRSMRVLLCIHHFFLFLSSDLPSLLHTKPSTIRNIIVRSRLLSHTFSTIVHGTLDTFSGRETTGATLSSPLLGPALLQLAFLSFFNCARDAADSRQRAAGMSRVPASRNRLSCRCRTSWPVLSAANVALGAFEFLTFLDLDGDEPLLSAGRK
jgi:hypothetical protein